MKTTQIHILKVLILMLILVSGVLGQKRIQIIDFSTKESISDVVVYSPSARLISDSDGYVLTNQFAKSDSITFSHIAYKKLVLSIYELELLPSVELTKNNIATEQVEVISKKDYENSIISEKISLNKYEKSSFSSTAEVLKNKTSLLVRDYGGEASAKTISSRG